MPIIPVIGLAKTLTAVTIMLHPAAHHGATTYTVRAGDSLSVIAARTYGSSGDWPAIWWANRRTVANPNAISAGEKLQLPASGKVSATITREAEAAASGSGAAPKASVSSKSSSSKSASSKSASSKSKARTSAKAAPVRSSSGVNWVAVAACESGDNWRANTGNGFYGGLQFSESTWLAYGGGKYARTANLASESEQIAVADRVLAGQGIGAWPVCGRRG
jgi:LysM repeat protein